MKVLAESNWNWILFNDDEQHVLSVVCGGVAIYSREVVLLDSEVAEYRNIGNEALNMLAQKISNNPSDYKSRYLSGFNQNKNVELAVKEWRVNTEKNS